MAVSWHESDALSSDELDAALSYYAESKMINASAQGWSGEFSDSKKMQDFLTKCASLVAHLDRAIGKHTVEVGGLVYSGHGSSIGSIGSLRGSPKNFVGLRYRYPGYISASENVHVANGFVRTGASISSSDRPVRLSIELARGQNILPLSARTGQGAEMEFLLPRQTEFEIVQAEMVRVDGIERGVLSFTLRRTAGSNQSIGSGESKN
ncbi:ADP-ribosyltransferase [Bradyrhizobium elkanii]|uniref:ADP-ribosyltransferase n=1 Tax=Bradyrhizobium elkanii TaxID=29448 RepID=UPI00272BEFBA|nr:ADP-ribosyltransferase [Bradyrhizobium elkanii]WLA81959.1 ADP-ribosyltransferase [Bradyrhizobium elkanii]